MVVIGAGAAGSLAARTARAAGAEVLVVAEPGAGEASSWDGDTVSGAARFASPSALEVGGLVLASRSFVLATGGVARRPLLAGVRPELTLTTDEARVLVTPPASLIVLGAGPAGLEVAQAFARRGTRVAVVDASPCLLVGSPEAGLEMQRALARELVLHLGTTVTGARETAHGVELSALADGAPIRLSAERIVFALGRAPRVLHLGLERAEVELFAGTPIVDRHRRTTNPRVFAAGCDAPDRDTDHACMREAEIAGYNAARPDEPRVVPEGSPMAIVFTDPPYARVGLDEVTARVKHGEIAIASRRFESPRGAQDDGAKERGHGLARVWTDRWGRILGGEVVGPGSELVVHLLGYAIHFGGTAEDLRRAEHCPPTIAGVLWDLFDGLVSARAAIGALEDVDAAPPLDLASVLAGPR